MRVLVTGGSSLPGYRTVIKALEMGHEVIGVRWRHPIGVESPNFREVALDIRDLELFERLLRDVRPDAVIHMAAVGDVDLCEKDRGVAWSTTVKPTILISRLSSRLNYFTLYLSTDYVFEGVSGGYREYDPPNPVNYYGLSKLCGEVATLSSPNPSAVVRASTIYGFGPGRRNFAKFLYEKLSVGESVKALIDQYTTPTQATLLAEAIMEIVERGLTGIFHVVGERFSRYEFALRFARELGFNTDLIREGRMDEMNWFARRPRDSSLNSDLTRSVLRTEFHSSDVAFKVLRDELRLSRGG